MIKPNYPQIKIGDLSAVIRESMTAKNDNEQLPSKGDSSDQRPRSVPELKLQPDFQPRVDDHYHVNDLLQYHDRAFIYAAYQALLKRPPGEVEYLRDRKRLQSGDLNKIDLLAALHSSLEAKAKKVQLNGLALPALVRRLGTLPLLGYALNLGIAFLRLPNQIRDQRQFAAYVLAQNQQIADFINTISSHFDQTFSKQTELHQNTVERFRQLDQQLGDLADKIEASRQIIETEAGRGVELRQLVSQLQAEVERLQLGLQHVRTELRLQQRNIAGDLKPSTHVSLSPEPPAIMTHQLDAFYAALEDRFRGTREEIKERFRVYVPYVSETAPVIDLGCGRGEWLEILKEAGIAARGVDKNLVQIEHCLARGLNVTEDDFLSYLGSLNDGSAGAVTGFHVVEHVSIEYLIKLIDEVMRVLCPGGVVIFETPNPENVLVGSNFFYMDPTHRHPLPSELMEFIFQNRGFHPIKVLNLNPWDAGRVAGETELANRFNTYFYGAMDYAILGWKVRA